MALQRLKEEKESKNMLCCYVIVFFLIVFSKVRDAEKGCAWFVLQAAAVLLWCQLPLGLREIFSFSLMCWFHQRHWV